MSGENGLFEFFSLHPRSFLPAILPDIGRFLQEHWKGHDLADQTGTIHFTYERNEQEQFKMDYLQKHIYKHQEQTNYLCNSYGKLAGLPCAINSTQTTTSFF